MTNGVGNAACALSGSEIRVTPRTSGKRPLSARSRAVRSSHRSARERWSSAASPSDSAAADPASEAERTDEQSSAPPACGGFGERNARARFFTSSRSLSSASTCEDSA